MNSSNKEWNEKLIKKVDPKFKHRWEVYNNLLINSFNYSITWIDCGCGNNEKVLEYSSLTKNAYGIDLTTPTPIKKNFIKADIEKLPIKNGKVDLITLRFVVEHFKNPANYFNEYKRVLKDNGKVILITTNALSPIIFIPRFLFPDKFKSVLITKIFKVKSNEVFKTYHLLNSKGRLKNLLNLKVTYFKYISDLNDTNILMFIILFIWHVSTMPAILNKFRTNFIAVLEKDIH